ncbi:MAG: STAS domain-containing protein [Methylacidiphilales bacterium]|nr:STAS domain-containing protein [Candidatus Methylacidiphilales bacterium]
MDKSAILVKQDGALAIARIVGKGSFKNARFLKNYAETVSGAGTNQVILDLQECLHMDSTFMGVLAGIACEQKKLGHQRLKIIHANSRNMELLASLGLNRILEIDPIINNEAADSSYTPLETNEEADKDEVARTMLDAHQKLIDTDKNNAAKFQDVITFLKNKLHTDGQ